MKVIEAIYPVGEIDSSRRLIFHKISQFQVWRACDRRGGTEYRRLWHGPNDEAHWAVLQDDCTPWASVVFPFLYSVEKTTSIPQTVSAFLARIAQDSTI